MSEASPETVLLINPVARPMQIGIYRNRRLAEVLEIDGHVSEHLVEVLESLLAGEEVGRIVYVHGPGSQMGIKLSYVTLKTLSLLRGIALQACSAFDLNGGRPLKAMGKLYFVKEKETIITRTFEEQIPQEFRLPESLDAVVCTDRPEPLYLLPAV